MEKNILNLNLNVGDKVICIKDYYFSFNEYIGKTFIIARADHNSYFINGIYFFKDNMYNMYYFNDYFISLKEQRKLKLERINESNESR